MSFAPYSDSATRSLSSGLSIFRMNSSNSGGRARIRARRTRASQLRAARETRLAAARGSRIAQVQRSARGSARRSRRRRVSRRPDRGRRGTAPTVNRSRGAGTMPTRLEAGSAGRARGASSSDAQTRALACTTSSPSRRQARGPRLARDRLADRLGPAPGDRGHVRGAAGRLGQRAAEHVAERLEAVASRRLRRAGRRARRSSRETAAASSSAWVVVRIVWPARGAPPRAGARGARGRARRRRRRAAGAVARRGPR